MPEAESRLEAFRPSDRARGKPLVKGSRLGAVRTDVCFDQITVESFPNAPLSPESRQESREIPNPCNGSTVKNDQTNVAPSSFNEKPRFDADRLGFGSLRSSQPVTNRSNVSRPSSNVKSVSSDQYFKNEPSTFDRERMEKFKAATSVSSSDFFQGEGEQSPEYIEADPGT